RDSWPERICALLRPLRNAGERDTREAPPVVPSGSIFYRIGLGIVLWFKGLQSLFRFTGEATLATARLFGGRSQMRRRDFFASMLDAGMQALPIVSLISFLVGVIIALLGAVVLTQFGAEFAVAYL
ncbi:ABC transporter permease, partial [Arthrospira platensis SPKY1]|nr:ABC transporter permease [Arthrospira platensis SPKY1]